jgi:hypothetical protein
MKFLSIKIKNRKLALLAAGLLSAFGAQAVSAQATCANYHLMGPMVG